MTVFAPTRTLADRWADLCVRLAVSPDRHRQMARCPAHDDRSPSLSVTLADNKILLRCFAGCDWRDVVAALDLTPGDLFADARPHHRAQTMAARAIKADIDPQRAAIRAAEAKGYRDGFREAHRAMAEQLVSSCGRQTQEPRRVIVGGGRP